MSTVAETIVAHLNASGVRRVYGLPGDSLNGFTTPQVKGVGLFAGRMIISGRGEELVELARENVKRLV